MFDPLLLRTFVSVAETLNFTRSAELLRLSQPTVSQHIRKLEKAAGRHLVTRDTRAVQLTDNGDALLGFARVILAAQSQAESYFTGSAMRGRLRFGTADDLALTQLPHILRDFRQLYPEINLELTVSQSGALVRRLSAGQLDLVFIKQEPGTEGGQLVRRDRMVWLGHKQLTLEPGLIETHMSDPAIARAAARDQRVADFLYWSRLPFADVRRAGDGTEVTIGDARYNRTPGSGVFSVRARVD